MEVTAVKRILMILLILLLPLTAQAVTTVPANVTDIQEEAFANTAIDALIIPASVNTVGSGVLRGTGAAYILVEGANTAFAADAADGVAYVFAPAGSDAAKLPGYRDSASLRKADGLYYFVQDTAEPLCAVDPATLGGTVTVPKLLEGVPVTSLDGLYLQNANPAELRVPGYLTIPEGMAATPYATMTITPPVTEATQAQTGHAVTWTTGVEGAYGDVTYLWSFTTGGETVTRTTFEPAITYAHMESGELQVSVTATDILGDAATAAAGQTLTLTPPQRAYRALLVGNTYSGLESLPGPDNDVDAMQKMLSRMSGTPFTIRTALNVTAGGMESAIASTFADAQASDVSLFYFSGHGTPQGDLAGENNTFLSVYGLRSALQQVPGVKIVLLDCCHSGNVIGRASNAEKPSSLSAFNRAVISAFASASRSSENLADEGYIVMTACRKDQESASITDMIIHFGAFTYGVCYGSGYDEWEREAMNHLPADQDGNRAITLGEAVAGVRERIAFIRTMLPSLEQEVQYYGDTAFVLWAK